MEDIVRKNGGRAYDQIAERIQQMIREGRLSPGDQLLSERKLAEVLGAGRNAVREALRILGSKGLIEITPGGGAYVREVGIEQVIDPLSAVILRERESVYDLLEARGVLEVAIARLVVMRATEADLERIKKAADTVAESVVDASSAEEADESFHSLLAEATHNRVLVDIMAMLAGVRRASYGPSMHLLMKDPGKRRASCEQLVELYNALARRDAEAAAQLTGEHISLAVGWLRQM